jgi:hypothetical protein
MKYFSIPSKPRFIFGSFVLLVSVFVSAIRAVDASAMGVNLRATAVPTFTQITSLPTNVPLGGAVDLSCPSGVPSGWGVVTPSTDWLYACGQCLPTGTALAFYTSTPGATHTPVWADNPPYCITAPAGGEVCYTPSAPTGIPSSTPTAINTLVPPTVSPTVGSYPAVTCGSSTSAYVDCTQVDTSTVKYSYKVGSSFPSYPTSFAPRLSYTVNSNTPMYLLIDVNSLNPSGTWTSSVGLSYQHYKTSGSGLDGFNLLRVDANTSSTVQYYSTVNLMNDTYTRLEGVPIGEYSKSYPSGSLGSEALVFSAPYQPNWSGFYILSGVDIYVSSLPVVIGGTATPTASPTVSPGSGTFCGSVSNVNVPNQFVLGGTGGVVKQSCQTTPGLSFGTLFNFLTAGIFPFGFGDYLSSFFERDTIIDPLTVCIRQRDYSLYIFGYRMPIELVAGLAIFLSGLRFVMPSVFSGASVVGQNVPTVSQTHSVTTTKTVGSVRISETKTTRKKG